MTVFIAVVFAAAVAMTAGATAQPGPTGPPPLRLLEPVTLLLDPGSGAGSGLVYLQNTSEEPVELRLTAGPLRRVGGAESGATEEAMTGEIRFAVSEDDPLRRILEATLESGKTLVLRAEVSRVWESVPAEADLLQAGQKVGLLRVALPRLPTLAVRLVTPEGDQPLTFLRGQPRPLTLANDAAVALPVSWRLHFDTAAVEGRVQLPPKSSLRLEGVEPPKGWFHDPFRGLFHDEEAEGTLSLRYAPGPEAARMTAGEEPPAPRVTQPVAAVMRWWPPGWRSFLGNLILLAVLTVGGVVSLLLHRGIPNRRRRLDLQETLERLAIKTHGLSSRIPSYLRVELRVERKLLKEKLASRWDLSPDFGDTLAEMGRAVTVLEARIDLLVEVGRLCERLEQQAHRELPPTLMGRIEEHLFQLTEDLGRPNLDQEGVRATRQLLDRVAGWMEQLDNPPEALLESTKAELRHLVQRAKKRQQQGGKAKEILDSFERLLDDCEAAARQRTPLSKSDFSRIDADRARLDLLLQYVDLVERSPRARRRMSGPIVDVPPASAARGARLEGGAAEDAEKEKGAELREWWEQSREEHLLQHLGQLSWEKLRQARNMVQQVREDIFWRDIREAISDGKVDIVTEPTVIYPDEVVHFELRFREAELNHAAALSMLGCRWDFGHLGLVEEGWRVCHYYPPAPPRRRRGGASSQVSSYEVSVTLTDGGGEPVRGRPQAEAAKGSAAEGPVVKITKTLEVQQLQRGRVFGERTKIELIQLAVALGAAVAALLGGAREQILKLDLWAGLVAVFLLGFGADTVKNLLTGGGEGAEGG